MTLPKPLHSEPEDEQTNVIPLSNAEVMENVLVKGDLKALSAQERAGYYRRVCESLKLNPLTKPFEYIELNKKLTLYARKDCTDQLRKIHGVSVEESSENELSGVYIVVCKVRDRDGRTDIARGAVNIKNMAGENLANALMKAETKAKRRATLSICGLGFLDETEVEDIPQRKSSYGAKKDGVTEPRFREMCKQIADAPDAKALHKAAADFFDDHKRLPVAWSDIIDDDIEERELQFIEPIKKAIEACDAYEALQTVHTEHKDTWDHVSSERQAILEGLSKDKIMAFGRELI